MLLCALRVSEALLFQLMFALTVMSPACEPPPPVATTTLLCESWLTMVEALMNELSTFAVNVDPSGLWLVVSDPVVPIRRLCGSRSRSEEHTSELQSRFGISYAV